MSLNLGNTVMQACAALRTDVHFEAFRMGLADLVHDRINKSLDAPLDQRVEATSYARALRDLWISMEAATLQLPQRTVPSPKPRKADNGAPA